LLNGISNLFPAIYLVFTEAGNITFVVDLTGQQTVKPADFRLRDIHPERVY